MVSGTQDRRTADDVAVVAPGRAGRPTALLLAVVAACVVAFLVLVASRQVHPGVVEGTAVAFVLLGTAGFSLVWSDRPRLTRAVPWVSALVVTGVAIGLWNPWHLAAVSLLLSHPFAAAIGLSGLASVLLHRTRARSRIASVGLAIGAILIATVVVAAGLAGLGNAGFQAPGAYESAYGDGDAEIRIDQHEVSDQGRCRAVVLRVGHGLTMRERVVENGCYPVPSMVVTATAIEVCVVSDYRWARVSRFDPTTLALLDEEPLVPVIDGSSAACGRMDEEAR